MQPYPMDDCNTKDFGILKHAVENTNEAFVTIDSFHKVYVFNKAAERIFGYSREEVIGRDLGVIMSPSCSRNHRGAVKRYIESRIPRRIGHETEITATRKNGDTFPASISFSVTEVAGELYFTAIVRDLTETKALQQKIEVAERLAALGQVVAEIAHEIKNPLMIIGGLAGQLFRATEEEKSREKLEIISDEVKRLEGIISDIREYYTPREMSNVAVDLIDMMRRITDPLKDEFSTRGIAVEVSISGNAKWIWGDKDRLRQVFLNLVKNAMEAMRGGGTLAISARATEDMVEVRLADEGSGISEKDKARLFTPFFTTKSKGTGLGLCVVKRIVEQHKNGSVSVESEEGKGTVFIVRLPRSSGPSEEGAQGKDIARA